MARPCSLDLRERVVRAVEAGASRRATAAKFEVSPSFVIKRMQRWRRHRTVQPERIGGRKRAQLAAHAQHVQAVLATEPDLTTAELRGRLAAAGIAVSRSALGRFLIAAGLTRKIRAWPPSSKAIWQKPAPNCRDGPAGAPLPGVQLCHVGQLEPGAARDRQGRTPGQGPQSPASS